MREIFAPGDVLLDIAFRASMIEWRGPAPFYFAPIPPHETDGIRWAARLASYGWGCVPVEAEIGTVAFTTSLFPRDGGYLLPLKSSVRKDTNVGLADMLAVTLRIVAPKMPPAKP